MAPPTTPDELWWAAPALKAQLLADPAAVLRERGITLPADLPRAIVHEVLRTLMLLWVDGRIVSADQFHIDPMDEGLLFGRGVWESTKTINGIPWLWQMHMERLLYTAKLLDIDLDANRLPDVRQVTEYVRTLSSQDVVLRLNVSAGRPGKAGMVWMSASLRPSPLAAIRLQSRRITVPKDQPYLIWKTFQYAGRLKTSQLASKAGFDSGLMLDADDNILEASHANIFLKLADGWVTPSLESGLFLPGTVRHHVVKQGPIKVREQVVHYSKLAEVSEAFVTNSNVGIVPVTRIDDRTYAPGPDTQRLQQWIQPGSGPMVSNFA